MARALFGIATDASVSDSVKLAAIRDALDRAGLNPKAAVEVDLAQAVRTNLRQRGGDGRRQPRGMASLAGRRRRTTTRATSIS
jgi:hypothetical protein